jgi:hypothetical protein
LVENSDKTLAGPLIKSKDNQGYLTLIEPKSELPHDFEQGRLVGKEQERARITKIFQNELRPVLMGVVFRLEVLELKLEAAGSPHMQQAVEAARMLSETVEKIAERFVE